MQEIMEGNHKDPSGFLCGAGKCNEILPEPPAFSFQEPMPFTHNIFTTLWQQLSVICTEQKYEANIFIYFMYIY